MEEKRANLEAEGQVSNFHPFAAGDDFHDGRNGSSVGHSVGLLGLGGGGEDRRTKCGLLGLLGMIRWRDAYEYGRERRTIGVVRGHVDEDKTERACGYGLNDVRQLLIIQVESFEVPGSVMLRVRVWHAPATFPTLLLHIHVYVQREAPVHSAGVRTLQR